MQEVETLQLMRVLIIDGSQAPPTFVGNLIQVLLHNGIEVGLLGKLRNKNFIPQKSSGFTRLVSDYPRNGKVRLLGDLMLLAFSKPGSVLSAIKKTSAQRGNFKRRLLDIVICAKIFSYNPDIIHFQWAAHIVNYDYLMANAGYKVVVSLRGMHINVSPRVNPELGNRYRELFPLINKFHAVSARIGKEAERYNAKAEKISVIYSMLSDRFLDLFRKEVNPMREPLSMLSIGRFHWQKGYRYGIEAVHILKQRGIHVQYTIVAGRNIPEEDLFLVSKFGIGDQVTFVDQVDHQRIPDLMTAHSVLLLPSVAEGIANVVLEAMAVGLPVISSDAGGMDEVIVNNETGWLVQAANSVALSNAIVDYMNTSEASLQTIRENAHAWVRRNNNSAQQSLKFIAFYRDAQVKQ